MADPVSPRRSHRAPGPATGSLGRQKSGRRPESQTRPVQRIDVSVPLARSSSARTRPATPVDPAEPPVDELFPIVARRPRTPGELIERTSPGSSGPPRGGGSSRRSRFLSRPPGRWPLVAGALAVLLVLGGVVFGLEQLSSNRSVEPMITAGSATDPTADPTASAEAPAATATAEPTTGAKVKLGVFLGTSQSDATAFANWLGRKPDYIVDFSSRGTWDEIANPHYMINQWRGTDYRMVYSVALLPWNGNVSIKAGSRGDYDEYYRTLARNLVAGGQEDAILRLGWEFNLKGWKWSTSNEAEFISYWRHIVTAMRSVPGEKLEFDWNPNIGSTPYDAAQYYPGGKYVDYVGVDVYDVSWDESTYPYGKNCDADCKLLRQKAVWDRLYSGRHGLVYWAEFARQKGKPMSLPEWGLWDRADGHGGGDNAYFIKQMHAFIDNPQNNVAYQGYLEVDASDGKHKLTTLTSAGKAFKKLFG